MKTLRQAKPMPVENYRVPAGCCAITIDLDGLTPTTFETATDKIADLVQGFDSVTTGKSYAEVIRLFTAVFRYLKTGHDDAAGGCLLAWWLAFRHPTIGAAITNAASDMMADGKPLHVTLHFGVTGGLVVALGERFVDLDDVAAVAKNSNLNCPIVYDLAPDRTRGPRH